MNQTILCYNVNVSLSTLRAEGFKVVKIGYEVFTDSRSHQFSMRQLFLIKGKKACWIWNNTAQDPIEDESLYKLWVVDEKVSLETLKEFPEETIGEKMERERREITDTCKHTKYGTAIYVIPPKKTFLEERAVLIQAEDGFNWKGDRYYRVIIPESIDEAERLFEVAKSEHVDELGKCGGAFWLQTTESYLETLLKNLMS